MDIGRDVRAQGHHLRAQAGDVVLRRHFLPRLAEEPADAVISFDGHRVTSVIEASRRRKPKCCL